MNCTDRGILSERRSTVFWIWKYWITIPDTGGQWGISPGGESFKASLSLALGLSDTVSSNLGGIQMDALFVDEGFGTLDRKSMEDAMDALINLSGTNKLVGIISHREELKENIPQQIKVKKFRDGSQITIETDM